MYSQVLVPLDGSKTAETVLPLARCFARSLQVPVQLLAVVDIAEMARSVAAERGAIVHTLIDDTTRRFENYLEHVARNFPCGKVHWTVQTGNAAEAIIESAQAKKQTLIAIATHGRSGLDRWLVGSVTEKVLRGASNSTLVVRAKEEKKPAWEMATLKRVIVALDGSELSEQVLPYVEELAKDLDLEVTLIRVYGGLSAAGDGFYSPHQLDALTAKLRDETVTYLESKTEEMKRQGLNRISFAAKEGSEADEILAIARQTPATMIAMCTHGRSGVQRWALGSITERVVRHSDNPVLVVRAGLDQRSAGK
jgi:nucleotide-binding universal stress UspA family protein